MKKIINEVKKNKKAVIGVAVIVVQEKFVRII